MTIGALSFSTNEYLRESELKDASRSLKTLFVTEIERNSKRLVQKTKTPAQSQPGAVEALWMLIPPWFTRLTLMYPPPLKSM